MRIQARVFGAGLVAGALLCLAPGAALPEEASAALSARAVTTRSTFGFPDGAHRSREIELTVHVDPGDGSARVFAHRFTIENGEGSLALRTATALPDGTSARVASFSLRAAVSAHTGDAGSWAAPSGGPGSAPALHVAYAWVPGRAYQLRVAELDADRWGAWVTDTTTGAATFLGSLEAPAGTGRIEGGSVVSTEYVGPDFARCSDLRLSRVSWSRPTANDGAVASTRVDNDIGDGACAVARTSTGAGPTVHMLGWSHVLYVGDSLAAETGSTLAAQLHATGRATVTAAYFPGMAICDFLERENASAEAANHIRARVRGDAPHLVVFQFWGNASTPCIESRGQGNEAYFDQYRRDAFEAAQQVELGARDAGIPRPKILWVLQGPELRVPPLPPGEKSRPERLNEIYALAARTYGDAVSDAGRLVSLAAAPGARRDGRYRWTQFLPCTEEERQTPGLCTRPGSDGDVAQLHKDDDPIHFCLGDLSEWFHFFRCGDTTPSPAIVRYGGRIAADVKAQLGL